MTGRLKRFSKSNLLWKYCFENSIVKRCFRSLTHISLLVPQPNHWIHLFVMRRFGRVSLFVTAERGLADFSKIEEGRGRRKNRWTYEKLAFGTKTSMARREVELGCIFGSRSAEKSQKWKVTCLRIWRGQTPQKHMNIVNMIHNFGEFDVWRQQTHKSK